MKRFLVVKTSAIGDVIQALPLIEQMKKRFPSALIDWVAEKEIAPLLHAHPLIHHVHEVDTKLWRRSVLGFRHEIGAFRKTLRQQEYDALFDLQGNTKSGVITAMAKARKKVGYSWNCVPERANYFSTNVHLPISQKGNIRVRYLQMFTDFFGQEITLEPHPIAFTLKKEEKCRLSRLKEFGFQRPRLMVCFGSKWENKRLSQQTLISFLHLIQEKLSPTFIFIFGNEEEKSLADQLERNFSQNSQTVGELSLPLWQSFMNEVEGVISMDSAALHLCGTTKTPSFSLFGPSSALAYKPLGDKHRAFQGTCPFNVQFDKRCPNLRTCESGGCLKDLAAEKLFEQFENFWNVVSQTPALTH